ncbi:MAG: glutathione synthase [Burkholderiaceae bacterium]
MKIAVLADPLDTFKTYKDTTYAMMTEAARRGHALYWFGQGDLVLQGGTVTASATPVTLTGDPDDWYRTGPPVPTPLQAFDAILLRKDPPFDMEYVYTTYLLELAERQGAKVVNKPSAVRDHNEKLAIAEFPQFLSPTLVTRDEARLRAFHAEHRDVILKPLDGMGGIGIFRVREDELNLGSIIETLTENGRRTIMAQRFIPAIAEGDKRVLTIGDKVVPFTLARIPQGKEVRGNLAAGGKGVAMPITVREREVAETLAPILSARGLLLVGLDMIGGCLTEINVTSPTCFQEIKQQTGFDVAAMFIDAVEAAAGSTR